MAGPADAAGTDRPPGMRPLQVVQFFLVLPLCIGIFLGAARIGAQQFVTVGHHIAYATFFAVLSWICYGIGAQCIAWVLRPWRPPLMVVLLLGNVGGGFALWWPLRDVLNAFFEPFLLPGSVFAPFWPPPADNAGSWVAFTVQGIAWWLLANWADFRYRRVPRFGFAPPAAQGPASGALPAAGPPGAARAPSVVPAGPGAAPAAADTASGVAASGATPSAAGPRLTQRLPASLQCGEINALEAEEHYTKVHTSRGNTLLLMRFSDAIAEMAPQPGLQVHRSFWVSRHAVERVARVDRRWVVQLKGGLEVPVSRSYLVLVQSAGLIGGSAMSGE